MATNSYGSVATPRIFVDYIQYAKAMGMVFGYSKSSGHFDFNPTKINNSNSWTGTNNWNTYIYFKNSQIYNDNAQYGEALQFRKLLQTINYYGVLGHKFGLTQSAINIVNYHIGFSGRDIDGNGAVVTANPHTQLIHIASDIGHQIGYSLVTIGGFTGDVANYDDAFEEMRVVVNGGDSFTEYDMLSFGTFTAGKYFDFPYSPELDLSISYVHDGVKTIRTAGGSDLRDFNYPKPKKWGDLAPLTHIDLSEYDNPFSALDYEDYSSAGRTGKRVFKIKYSYLDKTDMFPMNFENNMSGYYSTQEVLGDNLITNGTMANFGVGYEGQELIDTDGDGGGDTWTDSANVAQDWRSIYNNNVTNSKITGNGSNGWAVGQTAQKLITTADDTVFNFGQQHMLLEEGKTYKYTFKYRSNSDASSSATRVSVGYANFGYLNAVILPTNTGDAVTVNYYIEATKDAHPAILQMPTWVSFYASSATESGIYLEVSDIEVREVITPAGTWFDSDDGVHTDNIVGNFLTFTMGGQIPFIFQPDNTKQEFAICKLDKPSLNINQEANGVYSASMTFREL